jgi:hypothetical protein
VLTVWVPGGPDLFMENLPISGELIRFQSDYGDYASSCGGVAMSNGDSMNSSTQVYVVRYTWAPVVMSCLHKMASLPKDLDSWVTCLVLVTPWRGYRGLNVC